MKLNFRLAACGIAAALTIASCTDQDVKVDRLTLSVAEPISADRTDSVKVSIEMEYVVSGVRDSVKRAFDENIVSAAFGEDYTGLGLKDAADKYTKDFVEEYRKSNADLLAHLDGTVSNSEEYDYSPEMLAWENSVSGSFVGRHNDVVSYAITNYTYEGGAHGSTGYSVVNMNLKTGKTVTEDDFFVPGFKEALSKLLTAHLHDAMPDQESYDELFLKDIEPNGNFMVSEKGVSYIYGQYEIGPYSLGIITVNVPWNEIEDLVRK